MKFLTYRFSPMIWLHLALAFGNTAPLTLVFDDFKASTDSLWHFETATFRDGVYSAGKQADIPGKDPASGQLFVDVPKDQLVFMPRKLSQDFRSCFLAYRDDFLTQDAFAYQVRIELAPKIINPSSNDSIGGLFALIRYRGIDGNPQFARSSQRIGGGSVMDLSKFKWVPFETHNWITSEQLTSHLQTRALSQVTGIGLMYISGTSILAGSTALRLDGFKALGEMSWPRLIGHPEKATVWAGDTLKLGWNFTSRLNAEWHWFRNEKPVLDAHSASYSFITTLNDVRSHLIRAEISLENGDRITTETIRVQVKGKMKPTIHKQPYDTLAPIGGEAILSIQAEGIPPLMYQWYHNGKPVKGADSATYVLVPSNIKQGGQYQCEVTDRWGIKVRSHIAKLLVKPRLDSEEEWPQKLSLTVKAGVNGSDFYQADPNGYPDTRYAWNYMQAGVQGLWEFGPRLSLQGDLLFSRKGVRWEFDDHSDELKLDYAECPLFLRILIGKKTSKLPIFLLMGVYGSVLMDAQHQEDWGDWKGDIAASEFSLFDFGPTLGIVWQIGGLSLEWRTSLGIANLNSYEPEVPVRMWSASVMLGFTLIAPQEMAQ